MTGVPTVAHGTEALADERHSTRAARRVHILQFGLSSSIRALEEEFGVALFVRSTRRVRLTAAGRETRPGLQATTRALKPDRDRH